MLRGIRREYGCGCYWVREGGRRRGVAGYRNHKNNNHIIVFNNEKYHFRHNFWLLFVQAKNFLPIPHLPLCKHWVVCPHFGWLPTGLKQPLNTLKY